MIDDAAFAIAAIWIAVGFIGYRNGAAGFLTAIFATIATGIIVSGA